MNTSKLVLGAMLALAMSNLSYAETTDTALKGQTTSNAYIQISDILSLDQKKEVGKQYEAYLNQVKALEKTGFLKI